MDKKVKIIAGVVLAIIVFAILIREDDGIPIAEVSDGNTIVLANGTTVHLIGITSTKEGRIMLNSYLNNGVSLLPDKSDPFDPTVLTGNETVHAYVFSGEDMTTDLAEVLLKNGSAELLEDAFLTDENQLKKYRKAYNIGRGADKRSEERTPNYPEDEIILPEPPPERQEKKTRSSTWYTDGNMNLGMLEESCDYMCNYTKEFANSLAGKSSGPFNAGQICEIFDYCKNKWGYVNDPKGHEYLAYASESIESNLTGDCDDFAVLLAACMLSIGGDACVNTGFGPQGGHAFAEVDIAPIGLDAVERTIHTRFPESLFATIHTRSDDGHIWLNLDWFDSYPGGSYFECVERHTYPCVDGKWSWKKIL